MVVAAQSPAALELAPGSISSVSTARSFVRRTLDGKAPDSVSADLQLAVSELVTNAFEHGAHQPVLVELFLHDQRASLTVTSHQQPGSAIAHVDDWRVADPERLAGRGLGIVRALADDLELETKQSAVKITVHRHW